MKLSILLLLCLLTGCASETINHNAKWEYQNKDIKRKLNTKILYVDCLLTPCSLNESKMCLSVQECINNTINENKWVQVKEIEGLNTRNGYMYKIIVDEQSKQDSQGKKYIHYKLIEVLRIENCKNSAQRKGF